MKRLLQWMVAVLVAACNDPASTTASATTDSDTTLANAMSAEPYRPQIHFTPREAWMNDPNGMVLHNGVYHLFYQHYPDSNVWGPMHWGHATSKDLVTWQHQPIGLYPDSLGYIFSGSAVYDSANTTGFGKAGKGPLVAIFTHHDTTGEKGGSILFQNQSIAYSLDDGATWTKYDGNPVIKNPGIRDFRDPKLMWHEESQKWIVTLAAKDRVQFYSSPNLKEWKLESDFGAAVGAHGGVWECPDLFALNHDGKKAWVLLVSINPGGPNGGSATQYFTGTFDGHHFKPFDADTRWIDYGPDNYAGITWSNTGDRKIFIGWMNNWQYAGVVPTKSWRGAATLPRDLQLTKVGNALLLASQPVPELKALAQDAKQAANVDARNFNITGSGAINGPAMLKMRAEQLEDFVLTLSNSKGQQLTVGYDKGSNQYFIDRTRSGKTDFEKGFAKRLVAPRLTTAAAFDFTLVLDVASAEIFADGGLSVMTATFFPDEPFNSIKLASKADFTVAALELTPLRSMYANKSAVAVSR